MVRWGQPVAGNDARESNADSCSSVEPARSRPRCERCAEVRGEVVAVVVEEVVGGAREAGGGLGMGVSESEEVWLERERTSLIMASISSAGRNVKPCSKTKTK